jgi:HrpA-like RNA helicase
MSATIDETIFRAYFTNVDYDYLHLSGKPNFPIEEYFLNESIIDKGNKYLEVGLEKIEEIVKKNNNNSDTLFFVTTIKECDDTADKLELKHTDSFVMPLYSGIPSSLEEFISNKDKYKEVDPNYKRRIFVATNVAESSLTIDGIVYVIDTGLELNVIYDASRKINIMNTSFITKAQMSQRKGRAGRTQNGFCYHLYTKEEMEKAIEYPDPEIKLIDLKNLCLSLLILGDDLNKKIKQAEVGTTTDTVEVGTTTDGDGDRDTSTNGDIEGSLSSLDLKTELDILRGGGNKEYVKYDRFTIEDTKKIFENFIQPPKKEYIDDGFDFLVRNNIVNNDGTVNKLGRLVNISRMDVQDALSLVYAYNVSRDVFDAVLLVICAYTKIKNMEELFFNDVNQEKSKGVKENKHAREIMKDSNNSEHVFIYKVINKFNKGNGNKIFNVSTLKSIQKIFENQKKTLYKLFKRFDYKLYNKDRNKKGGSIQDQNDYNLDGGGNTIEKEIILSFCFGYKDNIVNRKDKQIIFNNIICDTSKTFVDTSKANKFIFYSNVLIKNKLYIGVVSPYM